MPTAMALVGGDGDRHRRLPIGPHRTFPQQGALPCEIGVTLRVSIRHMLLQGKAQDGESNGSSEQLSGETEVKYLVSASRDKTIKIFQLSTGACVLTLVGHDNWVRAVAWHISGKYIISCSDDRSIKVWDIAQKRCCKTLSDAHPHFVTCMGVNYRGTHIASGSVDLGVKVWECV